MYLDLLIKIRELLKLSEIYLSHAPKDQKYVSVKRIKELTWDLYIDVVKASKKYYKKSILYDIDCTHETLRCAWQLYFELGFLNFNVLVFSKLFFPYQIIKNKKLKLS